MSVYNKVSLFAWYASQYLLNPRYFNESFVDSMWAYFSTFIAKDDFTYLYHYLPWDEDEINERRVDVYIRRIREKIGEEHILTIFGRGYKFMK